MFERVDKKRLQEYRDLAKIYDNLIAYKHRLENEMNSLKSIDFSKPKVSNGSKSISSPEIYTAKLETLNNKAKEIKKKLDYEYQVISDNLDRIPFKYGTILRMYYLELQTTNFIVNALCSSEPDFLIYEHTKYDAYVKYWKKRALEELEKIGGSFFVKEQQLTLDSIFRKD